MLAVSHAAKEKIAETLEEREEPGGVSAETLRIAPSTRDTDRFVLFFDREAEGDQVVSAAADGHRRLLLVGQEVAERLDGFVLDYEESALGDRFVVRMQHPGAPPSWSH